MSDSKRKIIRAQEVDQVLNLESKLELEDTATASHLPFQKKLIRPEDREMQIQAHSLLDEARHEAEKIRKRAKQIYLEVEQRVKEATERGYADGHEAGLQALTEMALQMRKKNQEIIKNLEQQALELVYEIGRKVIGDCFSASNAALLGVIRQALQASMGNQLIVLVNPEDYQRIQSEQSQLMSVLHGSQTLILKAAETVKKSGCVIESEMGTLEADLDKQLEAIKKALGVG